MFLHFYFRLINNHSFNSSFQNIFESGFNLKKATQKRPNKENIVSNSQWDTCVILEETQTDITTHSEFGKFDFQVICTLNNKYTIHILFFIFDTIIT